MWGCEALVLGVAAYGLAAALVLPPNGPSAAVRAFVEARLRGTVLGGVTDCVLCSSVHLGILAGVWGAAALRLPAGCVVVVPRVAAAVAAVSFSVGAGRKG